MMGMSECQRFLLFLSMQWLAQTALMLLQDKKDTAAPVLTVARTTCRSPWKLEFQEFKKTIFEM